MPFQMSILFLAAIGLATQVLATATPVCGKINSPCCKGATHSIFPGCCSVVDLTHEEHVRSSHAQPVVISGKAAKSYWCATGFVC